MWSMVSTALTRMIGVDVVVDALVGRERFRPQSPRKSDESGAVIAAWVGYGRVAVSAPGESVVLCSSGPGRGNAGGREKSLECRSRFAVGESVLEAIGLDLEPET